MLRPSRCARVFAVLTRIRNTQVLSDDRPSKRSSAPSTRSHVSWTTSSATARDGREDLRDAEERGVPLAHDGAEGLLVAGSERGDELVVGERHSGERTTVRARTSGGGGPRGEFWARPPPR